jgi:hypothetical protein
MWWMCDNADGPRALCVNSLHVRFVNLASAGRGDGGKNKKLLDQVEKLRNEAAAAGCACFAGKVKGTPAFKAAEAQAAAIIAALTGK